METIPHLNTHNRPNLPHNQRNSANKLTIQKRSCVHVASNTRVVLALQIGAMGPVLHTALGARLALVPLALYSARFRKDLSSRVWVQGALFVLDDEGYLGLARSVVDIEQEARRLGMLNKSRSTRSVVRSRAFVG